MENDIRLTKLYKGETAVIRSILTEDVHQLRKLMAFGILPGTKIMVLQTFPVMVLQIDYTQLAMDHEIAEKIIVTL